MQIPDMYYDYQEVNDDFNKDNVKEFITDVVSDVNIKYMNSKIILPLGIYDSVNDFYYGVTGKKLN